MNKKFSLLIAAKFILVSLITAAIDYGVFFIAQVQGCGLLLSQGLARSASIGFNYPAAKRVVFDAENANRKAFPKFVSLVIVNGLISYGLINFFVDEFAFNVILAKATSELMLYLCNFTIQRYVIFTRNKRKQNIAVTEEVKDMKKNALPQRHEGHEGMKEDAEVI